MTQTRQGFTVAEVMIAMAVGSMILLLSTVAILGASRVFATTSGRDQAIRDLNKARQNLEQNLIQLSRSGSQIYKPAAGSLNTGSDGDVLNFVSAVNATTGQIHVLTDGSGQPYYFKNVLYYASVPTDHDTLYGQACVGGNDGGYDHHCPHKVLMRAEEDQNAAFDPTDASTQDTVLALPGAFLGRPTGFPKQPARRVVSVGLLSFRVQSLSGGNELLLTLQALGIPEARKKFAVGAVSARQSPYAVTHSFSVFPKNP
ncbi:prepilin-type N-terminal cleavage/methylation domain-containing protein [bacterium]|nr:prepilin-type N-terminal cleavage/methylation domain-containing protein [bacterium]